MIQDDHLSIRGERNVHLVLVKYMSLQGLLRNSVVRIIDPT